MAAGEHSDNKSNVFGDAIF